MEFTAALAELVVAAAQVLDRAQKLETEALVAAAAGLLAATIFRQVTVVLAGAAEVMPTLAPATHPRREEMVPFSCFGLRATK